MATTMSARRRYSTRRNGNPANAAVWREPSELLAGLTYAALFPPMSRKKAGTALGVTPQTISNRRAGFYETPVSACAEELAALRRAGFPVQGALAHLMAATLLPDLESLSTDELRARLQAVLYRETEAQCELDPAQWRLLDHDPATDPTWAELLALLQTHAGALIEAAAIVGILTAREANGEELGR